MLFIISCIVYLLVAIATTVWFVKVVSTYDNKVQDDGDILINTLLGILVGMIWPVAWLYSGLFGFAKRTYVNSKILFDEERDERRLVEEEKYNSEVRA